MKRLIVLLGLVAVVMIVADAQAFRVTTADGNGADCELRESSSSSNRGGSTEIASRIENREEQYWKKNSLIYLKFDVSGITGDDLAGDITVRTTYRNTNMSAGRIEDVDPPLNGGENTGFDYFVLDPTAEGADWGEMTITPANAPGYTYDGDMGTKGTHDFLGMVNSDLTYLGFNQFDSADLLNGHMPVGQAFDFTQGAGSALHNAIVAAQGTAHQTVTVIMGIAHAAEGVSGNWLGFNYLFNPKEMAPLNDDPGGLFGGCANANNDFTPMLTNEPHIPEPATMALLGFGGLALLRKRKA